ncbi:hypothetical protein J2S74_004770 [Evansella vedderi]|uniref:Uncharacterized protein n=1 Tax=Evansella vedderi TaxID=38282 RepID=A0ABU0A1E9_9BACI|nr:hypothetical protein [Evansella vedderi]
MDSSPEPDSTKLIIKTKKASKESIHSLNKEKSLMGFL